MKTRSVLGIAAALFALLPGLPTQAAHFRVDPLKVEGKLLDLVIEDMDEDGRKDLVAFCRSGERGHFRRFLTVFWQGPAGGFDPARITKLELAKTVIQVDFGRLDDQPGKDVGVITGQGVHYYPLQGRQFGALAKLFELRSLFAQTDEDVIGYADFVTDWNGDGRDDVLVHQFDRVMLFTGAGHGRFEPSQTLYVPMEADLGPPNPIRLIRNHPSFRVSYWAPQLDVQDADGDGRKDLVASLDDQVAVFLQRPDGRFAEKPDRALVFNLVSQNEREQFRDRQGMGLLTVADLDRDGKADLISNRQEGSMINRQSTIGVYWGKTASWEKIQPDQTMLIDKPGIGPLLRDVNGDGQLDLVVLIMDIGVYSVAKVVVTGSFNLIWQYFVLGPDGRYPDLPSYVETTPLKVDISKFKLIGGFPNSFADFNGDGVDDVVYGKSADELVVALKSQGGKPTGVEEHVMVPVGMIPMAEDLDGDRRFDVVLTYPMDEERKSLINVVINTGGW